MPTRRLALLASCAAALQAPAKHTTRPRRATARRLAPAELWTDYLGALEANPLPVKCVTAACVIGAGDAAAQAIEGLKLAKPLDGARVARWAFFGLVLQAPWNHFFQNALEAAIPSTPDPWTATTATKVAIDQGLQAPVFTALIFVFFAVIEGRGVDAGRRQVADDLAPTLLKNWLIFAGGRRLSPRRGAAVKSRRPPRRGLGGAAASPSRRPSRGATAAPRSRRAPLRRRGGAVASSPAAAPRRVGSPRLPRHHRGAAVASCPRRRDAASPFSRPRRPQVPATVVNLGLVPLELRVLFINVVFFFWVIILSLLINETA